MRTRSLFWPFAFIAIGAIWLLIQLGRIPVENLWALMYVWPFILMAIGVGLILRTRWQMVRMFVSGLIVLGMALSIVFAPQLGWNQMPAWSFITFDGVQGFVRGSGHIVSENRQVTDFNEVEIYYPVELTVKQGQTVSVTVTADDNLLPQLETRVSGGTLIIDNNQGTASKRVNPTKPVRIDMTVKDLTRVDFPSAGTARIEGLKTNDLHVSISGAGTVSLTDLNVSSLEVNLSGAGSISATGKADSLTSDISGVGSFHGDNLTSQTAHVTISGAGSATVWVKSSLNADISGTGSIRYYGSPSVQRDVSGLGSVVSLGNK